MSADKRARVTKRLALQIRRLPASAAKVSLAISLGNLATEGDFGRDTLQSVTTTLAGAMQKSEQRIPTYAYDELARLVHYEGMKASLDAPQFAAAVSQLTAKDKRIERADNANFTLLDLQGKPWTLRDLRGKVVLVNFWATWCPPCRKELPDIQALYIRFKDTGFVVLGVTDEKAAVVRPFVASHSLTYPILLDPGRKANVLFGVDGIPRTVVYDRQGKLAAQAIDMRTERQLLNMLGRAGLR